MARMSVNETRYQSETMLTFITHSPSETGALGEQLGGQLISGNVICLSGSLGAGKTCLASGLARGWGAIEQSTSPTFTLINEYHRAKDSTRFWHVDCYRVTNAIDAVSTGLSDAISSDGIVVIEWPEHVREMLPTDYMWVSIRETGDTLREMAFSASGPHSEVLLSNLIALRNHQGR